VPAPENGRGWAAILGLSLVTVLVSVVQPALLVFLPLAVLLLALPPRRPLPLALGVLIVGMTLSGPRVGSLWYFERGWALILSAWFVVAVTAWPTAGFIRRGLTAVFASMASAGILLVTSRGAFVRIDELMNERVRGGVDQVLSTWQSLLGDGRLGQQFVETVNQAVELQAMLFPALLALGSLAALALAWWLFRRLGAREVAPLGPLREFRFPDALIWLLIVGIVLVVLPLDGLASRAGSNLLVFMTALYALRGLAVLIVIGGGAPGPVMMVVGAVLLLLLYPLVMATTFFVGLSDTWLDIRTRRAAPPENSSQ
jgi:hypothetical protein